MSSPTSREAHAPVIIIRKKKGGHGHHGGAWKVAYADFVTAMMALFIVLWLLASSEEVQKAVGGYFLDPAGQGKLAGTAQGGIGESISLSHDDMGELKQKLEETIKQLPKFEQLASNVTITVTNEGLRIELLEKESGLFFENGSARMSEKGAELVRMLGEQLKSIPNRILLEGHTDSRPFASTLGYTNWELSADRANSARRILEQAGLNGARIAQIRGFADQYLHNTADPADPTNRRVSIVVQYRSMTPAANGETGAATHAQDSQQAAPPAHGAAPAATPPPAKH